MRRDGVPPRFAVSGQAVEQERELVHRIFGRPLLRLVRGDAAAQLRLILQRHIQLIADGGKIGLCPLKLRIAGLHFFGETGTLLLQLFKLVRAGDYAAALGAAAAGHRAAGVYQLSVQRNDAQAVPARLRHSHRGGERFRHDGPAQQVQEYLLILAVKLRELACDADEARVVDRRVAHHAAADGINGQECRPSGVHALQKLYRAAAVILGVDDYILRRGAQRRLYCEGALIVRADKICDGAVNPAQVAALRLTHYRLDRARVAVIVLLHLGEHIYT